MDDLTDDDLFLDMMGAIVLDALARIGDDPEARYAFFKRFVELAQEATRGKQLFWVGSADRQAHGTQ